MSLFVLLFSPAAAMASPSNWSQIWYNGGYALTPSTTIPVLVKDAFYASSTAYIAGDVQMSSNATTSGTHYVGVLGLGTDYINDLTGTGLKVTNNSLQTAQDITVASSPSFAGLTLTGLLQGSILFADSGGAVAQDNSNFYWDNANNFLGIGTNDPSGLEVDATNASLETAQGRSNVRIGIQAGTPRIIFENNTANTKQYELDYQDSSTGGGRDRFRGIAVGSGEKWSIDTQGRIFLGGASASYQSVLNVNGSASIGSGYVSTAAPTNGAIIQGKLGLNTTSPSDILTIVPLAVNTGIVVKETDGGYDGARIETTAAAGGLKLYSNGSLTVKIDGSASFSSYLASGANFGIGTSTPAALLHVNAGASATTTVEFGDRYSSNSNVCHNTKNSAGQSISFYFDAGNNLVIENNRCR